MLVAEHNLLHAEREHLIERERLFGRPGNERSHRVGEIRVCRDADDESGVERNAAMQRFECAGALAGNAERYAQDGPPRFELRLLFERRLLGLHYGGAHLTEIVADDVPQYG